MVNTNFEGADARAASFDQTNLEGANLKNGIFSGCYFDKTLLEAASMEGGDFTDAQIPTKTVLSICEREDVKGANPTTGVDTRESLMCLD